MKIAYLGIKGLPSKWGADRVVEALVNNLSARDKLTCILQRHACGGNNPTVTKLEFYTD